MKESIKKLQMKDNHKTCRSCKHRHRWQCGGSVFSYCGKIRSYRTHNGIKKSRQAKQHAYYMKKYNHDTSNQRITA